MFIKFIACEVFVINYVGIIGNINTLSLVYACDEVLYFSTLNSPFTSRITLDSLSVHRKIRFFYRMETHYDNPNGRADILDNSGSISWNLYLSCIFTNRQLACHQDDDDGLMMMMMIIIIISSAASTIKTKSLLNKKSSSGGKYYPWLACAGESYRGQHQQHPFWRHPNHH